MTTRYSTTLASNTVLIITVLYFTAVFNFPFLSGFSQAIMELEHYSVFFLCSVPILLYCLLTILISVVSIKYLFKPILIVLILFSSLVFYAAIKYGIVFDYGMIENTIESNSAEAMSYLNFESILYFTVTGFIPALFVFFTDIYFKPLVKEIFSRIKLIVVMIMTLLIILFFFYQDYASVGRNNSYLKKYIIPSQFVGSTYNYIKNTYFHQNTVFKILDPQPSLPVNQSQNQVIVMVVGETARAKNFSYNGYHKPTNGYTQGAGIVSFQRMESCGTATAVSVPCLFSQLQRENFDRHRADNQQNLLDIAALAGVDVLWIDNNGCKDVCNRVPTVKIAKDQSNPLCDGHYCLDEALLAPLQQKLDNLTASTTLIVLHMMGSHGPTYYKRYPEQTRLFTPDCQRNDIQNCSKQQLINTYDNTIAYTDFVLSNIIEQLDQLPQAITKSMIYVSDHGESLGESGIYLHGLPYSFSPSEQRHIPWLVWFPDQQFDQQCLQEQGKHAVVSHDNIFHTMLGLLHISSTAYQQKLDIFSDC